jgi:phenylpropionate dioxygenase-like ring-hydroxylating dioxygenase large terminal subunit
MNKVSATTSGPVTYSAEAYLSPEYARAERDKLWRKVWQEVGRVEEVPNVGDYLTYEILDDSILVVRTAPDKINAYHNVCQHRGRRLVDTPKGSINACGNTKQFVCGFHGWRWNLQGENIYVLDKDDWKGALTDERIKLKQVKVDTWGGWIFISMNPDVEPLHVYLEPVTTMLAPFELEKMRYRWRRWAIFNCNWKVGLEAFMEGYHGMATHPQFMKFADWYAPSHAQGKHSNSSYAPRANAAKAESVMRAVHGDARTMMAEFQQMYWDGMNASTTKTLVDAAQRLATELPEGTPSDQVMKHWLTSAQRDDAARGVVWPQIDPAHLAKTGSSWNIFPNFKVIQLPVAATCYNFRPYGNDPNKCIGEAFVIERFPEGEAPKTEWIYTPVDDPAWLVVLPQDFSNMEAVQLGMKSAGFSGARPSPVQENTVSNFHRMLAEYMGTGAPRPL